MFVWKIAIFRDKKCSVRERPWTASSWTSLITVWSPESRWVLLPAAADCWAFRLKYMKKIQPQPRSWKSQEYFNNLFRSLWIFFFDTARQWQGHVVSFLKASCSVWPKTVSAKFLSLVTLKSFGSPWTLSEWFCNIMPWFFGKYWFTDSCSSLNSWHVHCTLSVCSIKKATFVNVNTNLLGKVFNCWYLSFLQ